MSSSDRRGWPSVCRRGSILIAAAAVAGLGASRLEGQDPGVFAAQPEMFVNVTVIDGRGGAPRPETAILVWGGRIRAIGPRSQIVVPQGTTVVDLAGSWVVPGFINAHAMPRDSADLADMLASGIVAVREAAMPLALFQRRGREPFGAEPRPAVFVGGPVLDAGSGASGVIIGSEAEAVEAVRGQVSDGAEFISISPALPREWIVAVARAARRLDTPVWVDRSGPGWLLALRAGVDAASRLVSGDPALLPEAERAAYEAERAAYPELSAAAWLSRLDPEGPDVERAIGALLARDASVVPLLAAAEAPLACVSGGANCGGWSEAARARLRDAWPNAEKLVRRLNAEGVRLLVGSDAPVSVSSGRGFHRELELLVAAGLPARDVLGMATRNGAIALGRLHERGTLEVGKRADFLVLDGDPVANIRNARKIGLIFLEGRAWRGLPEGGFERVRFR